MLRRYSVSKEYRERGNDRVKQVKLNRALHGEIVEYPRRAKIDGKILRIYWSVRLQGEFVHRHRAWPFDKALIDKLRELGIPLTHIGVIVTADTKRRAHVDDKIEERWLIRKETFFADAIIDPDYGGKYLVPLSSFARVVREQDPEHKIKEMEVRK